MLAALNEGNSPTYISLQNANVYVSDARQMKLKPEAHRAINGFLDEFLYKIMNSSGSLTTDRLRAGLLTILPTSVGKEAITEAEVELRAFLAGRAKPPPDEDKDSFHLQWSFELLRQKCQGYCTMSDEDEDLGIQARVNEKMAGTGAVQPKESLLETAGLYLAAILESTCHHILVNVGRVASRDSSRMDATPADVFVALCEDNGIYALFKSMDVYEQIESLSKAPKSRRSKSFSRSDKNSVPRTSSHQDPSSSTKDSPTPPPGRQSSEVSLNTGSTAMSSRTSFDRGRALLSGRASRDGHKRSDSLLSEDVKLAHDDPSLQEFDDLMRSDSTLKVSLTPDRLKTMEVYKQEKDRGNRRPTPLQVNKHESDPSSGPSPAPSARRPSLRNESIVEADEESAKPLSGIRKGSVSSSPFPPSSASRARSLSTNTPLAQHHPIRKSSSKSNITSPSSYTSPMPARDYHSGPKGLDGDPFLQKKRKIQRNLESLDLDEVMAGSDDDDADEPKSAVSSPPSRSVKVSQRTRELMSFLDEGPPDSSPPLSRSGRELVNFLEEGPPDAGFSASGYEHGKKGSGRLQRMMSKLSLGNSEKGRQPSEDLSRNLRGGRAPTTPIKPSISAKTSATNLPALANKPIPPRYPPISPPSSPSSEEQLIGAQGINGRKPMPSSWEQNAVSSALPPKPDPKETGRSPTIQSPNGRTADDSLKSVSHRNKNGDIDSAKQTSDPVIAKRQITKSLPSSTPRNGSARSVDTLFSHTNSNDAQELRRLMARGTTAEECRLLLEMFLAKSNATADSTDYDVPYPSPLSDKPEKATQSPDAALESLVVELFLGGDSSLDPPLRKKRNPTRKKPATPSSPTNGALPFVQNTPTSEMAV